MMNKPSDHAQIIHTTIDQLIKIMQLHHRAVEKAVSGKQDDLHRGQMRILFTLNANNGAQCQRELAEHFEVSAANIARSLKTLETAGYVSRVCSGDDLRRNTVCLTEKGKEIVNRSIAVFDSIDAMAFDGFSDEELRVLQSMLTRIHQNLQNKGSDRF